MASCRYGVGGHGFTLVEILIVVVILGILAAIVIPQFADATDSARQSTFVADVRNYATQAYLFMEETGELVEDSATGQCPVGFDVYIDCDKWEDGTPIGGEWDFERDGFAAEGMAAGFGVDFGSDNPGDEFMAELDAILDDGNLEAGGFRKIADDRYYFILLPS